MVRAVGGVFVMCVGLSFVGACCGRLRDGGGVITTKPDRNPHPQSQMLKNGKLEAYWKFSATLADGEFPNSADVLHGLKVDGTSADIQYSREIVDPCLVDNVLPLYRVWRDVSGSREDLCGGQKYSDRSIPDEAKRCQGIDNLKKIDGLAVAIPGYFDVGNKTDDAQLRDSTTEVTFACVTGVVAKCAHWGYVPWAAHKQGGEKLAPYFKACVQAAIADYSGTFNGDSAGANYSYTCEGTIVDIFDNLNIQTDNGIAGTSLESSWDEKGLVSIHRPRYVGCYDNVKLLPKFGVDEQNKWLVKIKSSDNDTWPTAKLCPGTDSKIDACTQ